MRNGSLVVYIVANNVYSVSDRNIGKKYSTSNEERSPVGLVVCKIERKSSVEFIWYLVGRYRVIMLFNCLAVS